MTFRLMRLKSVAGFTLIELMVVVAIVGVLAAVAIPTFMRNARKAKTSEAVVHIRKIYGASRTYIIEEHRTQAGVALDKQFPEAQAPTPIATCCGYAGGKCPGDPAEWEMDTWRALQFSLDDPHYYRYEYESTGAASAGPGSRFTIRAMGDLNCNGDLSTFEMVGEFSSLDQDVHGSAAVFQYRGLE
jgi:prepilin-type N-terminal cleavage/methylation domain-containing protein